jgi:tetratricopeptide (TPR) repeat protein
MTFFVDTSHDMRNYHSLLFFILFLQLLSSCENKTKTASSSSADSILQTGNDALKQLNEQLASDPENADLLHQRAMYYLNTREYQKSFRDMMHVLNIDSSKAPYYLTLSDIYFYTNKTGASKRALEKAVELDERNTDALLKLAELYLYVKKHDLSIEYINKALKINPYQAKAYFMKGMNYKDMGDTAKAMSSMQTAVEQDQTYYHAYMQMGILMAAQHNPIAIQYYKNATRIQPNSTEAWYAIGMFYQNVGDWQNAITAYNALIAADIKDTYSKQACYNLGAIHLVHLKKYQEAVDYFTKAIQAAPDYSEAYYSRGLAYHAIGDTKQAVNDFQQCLRIDPDYQPAKEELKLLNKLK